MKKRTRKEKRTKRTKRLFLALGLALSCHFRTSTSLVSCYWGRTLINIVDEEHEMDVMAREKYLKAGVINAQVMAELREKLRPGAKLLELEEFAERRIR